MRATPRIPMFVMMLGLTFGSAALAQSLGTEFTTASGQKLILVPIQGMECSEIEKMLARIDATRYRGNAPAPQNEADAPLFEYELSLSEANYNRCALLRKKAAGGLIILQRAQSQ